MKRLAQVNAVAMVSLVLSGTVAGQAPAETTICTLLPKAEVKALLGATDAFDRVEPRPDPEPAKNRSACWYADFSVVLHDGGLPTPPANAEVIQGLGRPAYLLIGPGSVELFADLGAYAGYNKLWISRRLEAGATTAAGRSGVIAVAKALIAKIKIP
jgi:hypothetical protein